MTLFGSKKPANNDIPVDQVVSMRTQGLDNNQIIQTLQRNGYSSSQIFEAMNRVDMDPAASDVSPEQMDLPPPQEQPQSGSFPDSGNSDVVNHPVDPNKPGPDYNYSGANSSSKSLKEDFKQPVQPLQMPSFQNNRAETEELVESIIEEKWNVLVEDINTIIEWKNKVESRINSLEQEFGHLKEDFNKLHQAVIGKIGDYDKNILSVGAEVKAMEKVFSKVLPTFTENVSELSRVAETFKRKSK